MFAQFRTKYPHGSLISELIKIDYGKYIVKSTVIVDKIVLSSGLAAAETIELAEDRALTRAISPLLLETDNQLDNIDSNGKIPDKEAVGRLIKPEISSSEISAKWSDRVIEAENNSSQSENQLDRSANKSKKKSLSRINPLTDFPEPIDTLENNRRSEAKQEDKAVRPQTVKTNGQNKDRISKPTQQSLFDTSLEITPFGVEETIVAITDLPPEATEYEDPVEENYSPYSDDLSNQQISPTPSKQPQPDSNSNLPSIDPATKDLIAQTDREMSRLNWSKKQGRDYLIATYGKPSRYQLDRQALLEFLEFRKHQN